MSSCVVAEQDDADAQAQADAEAYQQLYVHFTSLVVSSLPSRSNGLTVASQLFLHGQGWYAHQGAMVCRDPKDTFVSLWHFVNRLKAKNGEAPLSLELAADQFCDGASVLGPYWEHVLGYWRAHLARPDQVLFFRYEEMQRDPAAHVRRLAEFVGLPFGAGEDDDGTTADAIARLCAFERMNELAATKDGKTELVIGAVHNSSFFRRGVVGDWILVF